MLHIKRTVVVGNNIAQFLLAKFFLFQNLSVKYLLKKKSTCFGGIEDTAVHLLDFYIFKVLTVTFFH